MLRKFEEKEIDKISYELLEKIYPTQALNSYYNLGMAEILSCLMTFVDYTIDNNPEKLNAKNMKALIMRHVNQSVEVAEFYERLQKDKSK